jgi:hypothetical protein
MVNRTIRKLKLYFNPPKKGDVFYGDPVWFVIARPVEYVLYGLKDKNGNTVYYPIPSQGCFKLTVEHMGNLNYILDSEVLCHTAANIAKSIWFKRSQPKRMAKEYFEELFLSGLIWR